MMEPARNTRRITTTTTTTTTRKQDRHNRHPVNVSNKPIRRRIKYDIPPQAKPRQMHSKHQWKVNQISEMNVDNGDKWQIDQYDRKGEDRKKWKIDMIDEKKRLEQEKWDIRSIKSVEEYIKTNSSDKTNSGVWDIYGIEDLRGVQENKERWGIRSVNSEQEVRNVQENKERWGIRSVNSEQVEEEIPPRRIPERMWSIKEVEPKKEEVDLEWQIENVASVGREPSECASLIFEETWDEYQPVAKMDQSVQYGSLKSKVETNVTKPTPVRVEYIYPPKPTSSAQVDTQIKHTPVTTVKSIKLTTPKIQRSASMSSVASSVYMEDSWVEEQKIPVEDKEIITNYSENREITRSMTDGLDLADHFTYQYEPSKKTSILLKNMTQFNSSVERPISKSTEHLSTRNYTSPMPRQMITPTNIPQTDCLKQSINVEHHDEELLDHPQIIDASGRVIDKINQTISFNSIVEKVNMTLKQQEAIVNIVITVEMYHNFKPQNNIWKRKEVTLTRTIILDLSKVQGSRKLKEIMDRCNLNSQPQLTWTDESSGQKVSQYDSEVRLTNKETMDIFYRLMSIAEDEEERSGATVFAGDNFYLTRQPDGQMTSVACEPKYMLNNVAQKSDGSSFLMY